MSALPAITVVIPSSGRWEFLAVAVKTVREQDGVQAEPLIVVNGPRSTETERLAELEALGARVIAIAEPGVANARNTGIDATSTPWVAVLDDDDLWAPDKLARQLAAAGSAGADFAYSTAVIVQDDLTVLWAEEAPDAARLAELMVPNNPIPACSSNLLVRSEVARTIRFDRALKHLADWDFATRLISSATGAPCHDVHVGYLWHATNMHTSDLAGIEREFAYFRRKHMEDGRRMGGPSQSRWLAGAYRKSGQKLQASRAYLQGAVRYRSLPDFVRAGAVLFGERAMALGAPEQARPDIPYPAWLERYR
jgi:glycosyltransferase involved in cell wall biosynthesis